METVFVVGAGPAGLFATKKLALAGHQVIIFNRDIKPGGLGEYGIYPAKEKMKAGLRKQFDAILALSNVAYFGNVSIGDHAAISLRELKAFSPAATVIAVGAQGTKNLGIPGENARGVYAAKDFVYHYNALPPYATSDFSIGKRVAVIGMGNVMVDVVRWLLEDDPGHRAEEVTIIARRGPFEAKFDEKEFAAIDRYFDRQRFSRELVRIASRLEAVEQNIVDVGSATFPTFFKAPVAAPTKPFLQFRFLASPSVIHADPEGRIAYLTVAENKLVARDGGISAKTMQETTDMECDTLIFAIGDVIDAMLGLPCGASGYAVNPAASDPAAAYELFDAQRQMRIPGFYAVGWARKASEGLVGNARHDAEQGAAHVLSYLEHTHTESASDEDIRTALTRRGIRYVTKDDLRLLARREQKEAAVRNVPSFKFADNETMFSAIEEERRKTIA